MNQEKIGKFIAQCRKEKNITQQELAEKIGVTNKSISRWENGKNMPDYSILKELCNILDIDVNELLSGEKIKEKTNTNSIKNLEIILKEYYKVKKQRDFVIISVATFLFISFFGFLFWIYTEQYNLKGVSHFLLIATDENISKQYVGELNNHKVYVEGLDVNESNFRTYDAEALSLKDAIEKKLVSLNEWRRYALKTYETEDEEVLIYQSHEIIITSDECIIKPLIQESC